MEECSAGQGYWTSFLGKLQLVTFKAVGCAMFYLTTGRQQFPWKELAQKRGHCSVGWKTTLCQPAGEERKKDERDQGTRREGKQKMRNWGKARLQQEEERLLSAHFSSSVPALFPAVAEAKSLVLDHSWTIGVLLISYHQSHWVPSPYRAYTAQHSTVHSHNLPIILHYCNIPTHIQQLLSIT